MPRPVRALVALCAITLVSACTASSSAGSDTATPTVAVTTNILADVVSELAGDDIEVIDLMPRGADPHSFELSAAQAAQVTDADLVVVNGLGLEEGLGTVLTGLADDQVPLLEIGPALDPIAYAADVAAGGPTLDPHVWTDPFRMVTAVDVIADALIDLAPDAAAGIRARADSYADELIDLDRWTSERVAHIDPTRRHLVTSHHVFGYFADRYGFVEVGAIIPSGTTLASPSAADLAELTSQITDAGVTTIFADSSQPDRLARALASEAGVEVQVVSLYTESLGPEGSPGGTYLDMMRFNATAIVESLDR